MIIIIVAVLFKLGKKVSQFQLRLDDWIITVRGIRIALDPCMHSFSYICALSWSNMMEDEGFVLLYDAFASKN